jgi:nitroreductase
MTHFGTPITELIRRRTSWRSYQDRPLAESARRQLQTFMDQHRAGPLGGSPRFTLVAATQEHGDELRGLGTYGFIRNPAGYVVGAVRDVPGGLEDFGYVMERLILRATDLGLGTCWLGGSFSRSSFAVRVGAMDDEAVPAVFSVGYPETKRGVLDRVVRWGAGSHRRRPWRDLFFEERLDTPLSPLLPLTKGRAGPLAEALEMVRLAPSASNRQPWRVVVQPDAQTYHFLLYREPKYNLNLRLLKLADLPRVDLGIAMCHFEWTAKEAGLAGTWSQDRIKDPQSLPKGTEYIATWTAA